MLFKKFIGEKGKIVGKCFERESAVTWSLTASQLRELSDKFRVFIKSEYWYLINVAPSSSQGDQSKLGGPEESLFECSPGIGSEERPPIAIVVQAQEQVLSSNSPCFNNCVKLNVMFVAYDIKIQMAQ